MEKEDIKVGKEFINKMKIYRTYNTVISDYFYKLALEEKTEKFNKIGDRIAECNRLWVVNYFKDIKVKELKRTHLCKNKFCFNCKKVKQAFRMAKYSDFIRRQKNAYHLVLTVPSVPGEQLKDMLKLMAKSFRRLYGILNGRDKFKMPFPVKVIGALRSLEITYSEKGFHPHYHVLLVLDSSVELLKNNINKFSYSYRQLTRTFSDLELFIQKLWQAIILNKRLNLNTILDLDGYSCILDEFKEGDFLELFKYLCKEADMVERIEGEEEKYKFVLSYEHFKILYKATYNIKQLQGYGTLYNIKDDFDLEELRDDYDEFIKYLNSISGTELKHEYLLEEDFWKKHKFLKESGLDHNGFLKNFDFVKPEEYDYISFKKYVSYVTRE